MGELHNSFTICLQVSRIGLMRIGETRNVCAILVGNPHRKRPLWTRGRRQEDNIKIGCEGVNRNEPPQEIIQLQTCVNRVVNF